MHGAAVIRKIACARVAKESRAAAAIPSDGRRSKSAVADFDSLSLPQSGEPDFGGPRSRLELIHAL
jgi:hypothetical protein